MNATDVVGYAYEADVHCLECTEKRFPKMHDYLRAPETDREGNEITPIFAGEDAYEDCGQCSDGQHECPECHVPHNCGDCDATGKRSRVCGDCLEDLIPA